MIIVEQSLNVALVDRRPGGLHGEGRRSASRARREELAERDDLARAVFLGA